ncbi:MAG: LamG-like jellyroll fold domain-containing protein [Desulforhopalus sp.]
MKYTKPYQVILFIFLFVFLGNASGSLAKQVEPFSQWVGKDFRLVWVQDQGNGSDTLGHGKSLMLYGYDSRDGKGERPLIKRVDNYFKPFFTPDGSQVIFSNRKTRQMYQMDWETGALKHLGSGVAVAVWQDPAPSFLLRKKTIWVYCFAGDQPENKYGTAQPMYRFPLNKPKKKELVWNKTSLAWSNMQLSRDGEVLGGLFPWPDAGVLWTKDSRWQRFGRGCWTSVSPDNSKLLWIFDGLHRNVQMHDVVSGESWKVNINGHPYVGGYEVYHPRWSNHPRFFVITGPYEKGENQNRIMGGGEKVEIMIGRFDKQARKVEAWLKVTDNKRADFYPDLWIEGGDKAQLADKVVSGKSIAAKAPGWPTAEGNLLFVWENMKAANQLPESSPVGFYQCNIELRGNALHTRHFQLALAGGWADTGDAGAKIGKGLADSGKATLEFTVTSETPQQGTIMNFGSHEKVVLEILQKGEDLIVTGTPGGSSIQWQGVLPSNRANKLALVIDGVQVDLLADGKSHGRKDLPINFKKLSIDVFTLGDKAGKWNGRLENLALYNKVFSASDIQGHVQLISDKQAQRDSKPVSRLFAEATLLETTDIPAPDGIGAYRRALVVNTYSVDRLVEGEYKEDRVLVAEWAILDRKIVKQYSEVPESELLVLEKFDAHPELEGERQMMDIFEPDLEMYYRLPDS